MSIRLSAAEFQRQFGYPPPLGGPVVGKAKAQIRIPKAKKQTKCEEECERLLKSLYPGKTVLFEPWSFKLPSGTRYTVDFIVLDGATIIEACESKGPKVLNGHTIRAFKEAKAAFPQLKFVFRQKTAQGWAAA